MKLLQLVRLYSDILQKAVELKALIISILFYKPAFPGRQACRIKH
jgi:hypothetical protein